MLSAASGASHTLSLAEQFAAAMEQLGPFGTRPRIAVAVSGGADSLALTFLAHAWVSARGGTLNAVTVDHGMRAESRTEAEYVSQLLQRAGIAHVILTPPHDDVSNNVQEAARQWRYDALAGWCRQQDVLHCLIAHHAGDQLETVALMQARGNTADGASGMAPIRNYNGIRFLRPLLCIPKSILTDYLTALDISWIEDPSNQSFRFARVRVRDALQQNPDEVAPLADQWQRGAIERSERDARISECAARLVRIYPLGYAEIALDALMALEPSLATQLLADCLVTVSGRIHRPRHAETQRLYASLRQGRSRATLLGCDIIIKKSFLRIAREMRHCADAVTLQGDGFVQWDERFNVHYRVPSGHALSLRPLGSTAKKFGVPASSPSLWHLDAPCFVPYIPDAIRILPEGAWVEVGFAPRKPLASAPFWWLN